MGPLKYLFKKPTLSERLSRWLILLAEFDLKYVARKTIKGSVVSDFCAENPIEGKDGKEDFLDEEILDIELRVWRMYFDEAINQYRNGIGILLITPEGSHIPLAIKLNFEATNNMFEYEACIARMEAFQELGGNGGRTLWRFNFGYSPSTKVVEGEGRTFEALPTILGGHNQDL